MKFEQNQKITERNSKRPIKTTNKPKHPRITNLKNKTKQKIVLAIGRIEDKLKVASLRDRPQLRTAELAALVLQHVVGHCVPVLGATRSRRQLVQIRIPLEIDQGQRARHAARFWMEEKQIAENHEFDGSRHNHGNKQTQRKQNNADSSKIKQNPIRYIRGGDGSGPVKLLPDI